MPLVNVLPDGPGKDNIAAVIVGEKSWFGNSENFGEAQTVSQGVQTVRVVASTGDGSIGFDFPEQDGTLKVTLDRATVELQYVVDAQTTPLK